METNSLTVSSLTTSIVLLLTFALSVYAQTRDSGGADNNIASANNSNPNGVPVNGGAVNLVFAGGVRLASVVNASYDVNGATVNNIAGAFTIGGSVRNRATGFATPPLLTD